MYKRLHWFFRLISLLALVLTLWIGINYVLPHLLPESHKSNAEISGLLIRNQVWEGDIKITGDTLTLLGTKVTIKPGTKITVSIRHDKLNMDYLPWHLRSGINTNKDYHGVKTGEPFWDEKEKIQIHFSNLEAIGTVQQPITFKSDSEAPGSPYDFNSLKIKKGVIAFNNLSNYRRMEIGSNVTVRDSHFNNIGECAVCVHFGSPSIINNTFENTNRESIYILKSSPRITDNLFINSKGAAIRIDSHRFASPIISYNTFETPQELTLDIQSGGEVKNGVVSFNYFAGNTIASLACDTNIRISQNIILGQVKFQSPGCGASYTFGPNFWDSADLKGILNNRIINIDQNFKVLIPSIIDNIPQGVGRRNKS